MAKSGLKLIHTIRDAFQMLTTSQKRRISLLIFSQSVIGIFDLISMYMIGAFVSWSLKNDSDNLPIIAFGNFKTNPFGMNNEQLSILIVVVAIIFLILKTFFSIHLAKKTFSIFSKRASEISMELIRFYYSRNIEKIKQESLQTIIFSTTRGVDILALQVMATLVIMLSDLFLLTILVIGIGILDVQTAIATALLFLSVAIYLNIALGKRSDNLGSSNSQKTIHGNTLIESLHFGFRELYTKGRVGYVLKLIEANRSEITSSTAQINFIPYISKYTIEVSLVIGGAILTFVTFAYRDIDTALTSMAVFLVAASRIAPAVLRLQQSYVFVRSYLGMTEPTLNLISEYLKSNPEKERTQIVSSGLNNQDDKEFVPSISIENLKYRYENNESFLIEIPSLEIEPGTFVALVGPSGSGKSTLIDLVLGLLPPLEGSIKISNVECRESLKLWPASIAYVPQEIRVFDGTVKENVLHGYSTNEFPEVELLDVIQSVGLGIEQNCSAIGLEEALGVGGRNLSVGQAQRIGIARALIVNPKLLILDESTSALDADSESLISKTVKEMNHGVTTLVVAHRLSTIMDADVVIYMEQGKIIETGTFSEVRKKVANFDRQAKLMGL